MNRKTQDRETLEKELGETRSGAHLWYVGDAFAMGPCRWTRCADLTKIDKWFLVQIRQIVNQTRYPTSSSPGKVKEAPWRDAGRCHAAHSQAKASRIAACRLSQDHRKAVREHADAPECALCTSAWTPVRRSSPPTRHTCIRPTRGCALQRRRGSAGHLPATRRSWCWAVARTASVTGHRVRLLLRAHRACRHARRL